MLNARVILDSLNPYTGTRLATLEVTLHHYVAKELLTHRDKSRNAASSRALPYKKFRNIVIHDPALPVYWGKHQPGMGASEELDATTIDECRAAILEHRDAAVRLHEFLEKKGLAKEVTNRYLEPWFWITYIVSATEWDNFFYLRCHPAAQPEMRAAAEAMRTALAGSTPTASLHHIPYVTDDELKTETLERIIKVAVARVARVSYLNHAGIRDLDEDVLLHDRLLASGHMSPFEHVATAMDDRRWSGNFRHWKQYRKAVEGRVPPWQDAIPLGA